MPVLLCALFLALGLVLQPGSARAQEKERPPLEDAAGPERAESVDAASSRRSRSFVLLWLAHERDGERVVFDPEVDPALHEAVRERSLSLDAAYAFPLADLEDRERLPAEAVWAGDAEAIGDASDRYGGDVVLAGAVGEAAAGRWRAEWTLLPADGAAQHFRTEAAGMTEAVLRGIDAASARLAAGRSPASSETPGEQVRVRVGNVATLGDFGRVLGLLRGLEGVEEVVLYQTRDDVVVLDVHLQGGAQTLDRRVRAVDALEPAAPEGASDGAQLAYRLRP
jgi:hypothetical protein